MIICLLLKDCVHIGLTLLSFENTGGRRKLLPINGVLILSCPDVKGLESTILSYSTDKYLSIFEQVAVFKFSMKQEHSLDSIHPLKKQV